MFKGIAFFIKYGWKYDKFYIIWRFLFQLVNSMIPIVATIVPKYIIDELLGERNIKKIALYVVLVAVYTLVATVLSNYFNWDGFSRRCKVAAEFDSELHKHLADADFERLEDPEFLDMQTKAKKFLYCDWHGFGFLLDCAMTIVGQCFTLIGISVIISTFDWRLLLVFIILTVTSSKIESIAKKKAMKLSQYVSRDQRGWMYYAGLFEDFGYGKEIRVNSIGKWLLSRERKYFESVNSNLKKQNDYYMKSGNWNAYFTFIQQLISYLYLSVCIINNSISIGSFTMYIGAITSFATSLKTVVSSVAEISTYDMFYEDLDKYLSLPTRLREGNKKVEVDENYVIEFKNVSFKYPGSEKIALQNVNIVIKSGTKLAVVGENGAGKTTFIKLLTRLYDPTEGEILFNGVNIKDIDYEEYMSLFSTVFQDYKLFALSLKENVALSLPIDEQKVEKVLKRVGFGEKLGKLPKGINTVIYKNFDETGFEPSGGEGQKIALARAIYKDACIVVLDEPTAALDPRAEYEMYQNFNCLVEGKTAVYISHRLSSTRFCDEIIVFNRGRIMECGSHNELISKKNGIYRELFYMQARYYE